MLCTDREVRLERELYCTVNAVTVLKYCARKEATPHFPCNLKTRGPESTRVCSLIYPCDQYCSLLIPSPTFPHHTNVLSGQQHPI